jgi:hypothetical protein
MNISFFLLYALIFCGALYFAYDPWFRPEKYLDKIKQKRRQAESSKTRFLASIDLFDFLEKHTGVDLWLARITSIIFIVGSLFLALAVLGGTMLYNISRY